MPAAHSRECVKIPEREKKLWYKNKSTAKRCHIQKVYRSFQYHIVSIVTKKIKTIVTLELTIDKTLEIMDNLSISATSFRIGLGEWYSPSCQAFATHKI